MSKLDASHLSHLAYLDVSNSVNLTYLDVSGGTKLLRLLAKDIPNLKEVRIHDCSSLNHIDLTGLKLDRLCVSHTYASCFVEPNNLTIEELRIMSPSNLTNQDIEALNKFLKPGRIIKE